MAAQLNHRFSNHLLFSVNYTWSHALDFGQNNQTATVANNLLDPQNLRAEYGNSLTNIPNRFVMNAVLTAPWKYTGWVAYLRTTVSLSEPTASERTSLLDQHQRHTHLRLSRFGQHSQCNRWRHQRLERNVPHARLRAKRLPAAEDDGCRPASLQALQQWPTGSSWSSSAEAFNIVNHQNVTQSTRPLTRLVLRRPPRPTH